MKLCRFGEGRLGVVEGDHVRDLTQALDVLPPQRYPFPTHDILIANLEKVTSRIERLRNQSALIPLKGLKLLSPVANPGKIVCAPVNYQKHLDEVRADPALHHSSASHTSPIQQIGLFLKSATCLVGPSEGIALRKLDRRNDHEVELAFVIGKTASQVSAKDALDYVAGYAIGLDITIRGSEDRSFRKSPDSYCVLGPWLVTKDEIPNPGALDLTISVNGETRQASNTKYLILGVAELIEFASAFYTLYPGDVVITGTPEGVSPIAPGDHIVASIEKIGSMEVDVRAF